MILHFRRSKRNTWSQRCLDKRRKRLRVWSRERRKWKRGTYVYNYRNISIENMIKQWTSRSYIETCGWWLLISSWLILVENQTRFQLSIEKQDGVRNGFVWKMGRTENVVDLFSVGRESKLIRWTISYRNVKSKEKVYMNMLFALHPIHAFLRYRLINWNICRSNNFISIFVLKKYFFLFLSLSLRFIRMQIFEFIIFPRFFS